VALFAQFVGPQDNWLPPDNFQEYPTEMLASRTSPTNIGLALLANLAAWDFGYIGTGALLRRTEATLATMEKLERYRGHFYNWYDTRTLTPLRPQYVTTVDSGNLAGCLITLQAGLAELKDQPVLPSARVWQGSRIPCGCWPNTFSPRAPRISPDRWRSFKARCATPGGRARQAPVGRRHRTDHAQGHGGWPAGRTAPGRCRRRRAA
jgi:hypothetical protein